MLDRIAAYRLYHYAMNDTAYLAHLAAYNQWMNAKLYAAAAALPPEQLHADRGAFFGSIFGTLGHIAVGDLIWFNRIAAALPGLTSLAPLASMPRPTTLDARPCATLADLADLRARLDAAIVAFCAEVQPAQLEGPFAYASTKGVPSKKRLGDVLGHIFNHQTHHRGQATTLFSQLGVDIGPTDLIVLLPNLP